MPVVTPNLGWASTVTVNAVPSRAVLVATCGPRPSLSQRSPVNERQINPRPNFDRKLIACGEHSSAARTRSPSFSRSSSSTRTIMRPARSSSRISGMGAKGIDDIVCCRKAGGKEVAAKARRTQRNAKKTEFEFEFLGVPGVLAVIFSCMLRRGDEYENHRHPRGDQADPVADSQCVY